MAKKFVLMETRRDEYSLSALSGTMTVGELISQLSAYDEDTPIAFSNDNGYTYGAISDASFRIKNVGDDD